MRGDFACRVHDENLDADACIACDPKRKSGLQGLAGMHGNGNYFALARLGIDVVASTDAPE